jgi:hypothetical protein
VNTRDGGNELVSDEAASFASGREQLVTHSGTWSLGASTSWAAGANSFVGARCLDCVFCIFGPSIAPYGPPNINSTPIAMSGCGSATTSASQRNGVENA